MSEGLTTEMSVLTEVQNLKDAIRIASGMEYVDPQKIYLMEVARADSSRHLRQKK